MTNANTMKFIRICMFLLLGGLLPSCVTTIEHEPLSDLVITGDFPGGNIIVDRIADNTVYIRQDLRDSEGWWFYWNFKVSGAAGRTLKFQFDGKSPIGVLGPAVRTDQHQDWAWLGKEAVNGSSFIYTFPQQSTPVQLAFSIPYQESDLDTFLAKHKDSKALVEDILCTSAKGRPVEMLRVGCINQEPQYRVLFTARHHACESIASFVMEGILEDILTNDTRGAWFREHVEVLAIPFMDKDGVEDGDQGKNRIPRDHNRDYVGTSIHPEVSALRAKAPRWSEGKLLVTLDLHCPYIRGDHNEDIYLVGNADTSIAEQQQRFSAYLEKFNTHSLPYLVSNNLLFGQAWNTNSNYSKGKSFSRWGGELEDVQLSGTFEIPYANVSGTAISEENARDFGQSIAKALHAYLVTTE